MEFIINNWYIIIATLIAVCFAVAAVVRFFRQPSEQQIVKVKEWLLWAVISAEREFGGGTGTVKLRSVYDLFVARWPWLAKLISFETFSGWVDEALDNMRKLLEKDLNVAAYVYGVEDGIDVDDLTDEQLRTVLEQMGVVLTENEPTREELLGHLLCHAARE